MSHRKVVFRDDGYFSITDDPDGVIYTFIGGSIYDMQQLKPSEFKAFIAQFDPMGEGHYVYDVASAYRTVLPPRPEDYEPRTFDDWTIQLECATPTKYAYLSGDELRDLFRQAIIGVLPVHPELKEAYDDL